jgi:hypothetical protein
MTRFGRTGQNFLQAAKGLFVDIVKEHINGLNWYIPLNDCSVQDMRCAGLNCGSFQFVRV